MAIAEVLRVANDRPRHYYKLFDSCFFSGHCVHSIQHALVNSSHLFLVWPSAGNVEHLRHETVLVDSNLSPFIKLNEVLIVLIDPVHVKKTHDFRRQLPFFNKLQ